MRTTVVLMISKISLLSAQEREVELVSSTEASPAFSDSISQKPESQPSYDFQFVYKGDWVHKLSPSSSKKSAFLSNVDAIFTADLDRILGLSGLSFVAYGLGDFGGDPSEFIGDSFGTSNIEAPDAFKI